MKRNHAMKAFTLVETVLALAVVAMGLLAVLMMVPLGLEAARISASQTVTATILEDIHNRLQGQPLEAGPVPNAPYFYDEHGVYVSMFGDQWRRTYRVDLEVTDIDPETAPADSDGLKSVVIRLGWPVKSSTGELLGEASKRKTMSYFVTTLAGPGWEEVDGDYKPRIEF